MADSQARIKQLSHLSKAQNAALGAAMNALKGLSPEDAQEVLDHAIGHLVADDQTPMFARGIVGPLGKVDHELKTKVDEVTYHRFRRSCVLLQTDSSARLRDAVYALEWGKSYRQMVMEKVRHEDEHTDGLLALVGHIRAPEFLGGGRACPAPAGECPGHRRPVHGACHRGDGAGHFWQAHREGKRGGVRALPPPSGPAALHVVRYQWLQPACPPELGQGPEPQDRRPHGLSAVLHPPRYRGLPCGL